MSEVYRGWSDPKLREVARTLAYINDRSLKGTTEGLRYLYPNLDFIAALRLATAATIEPNEAAGREQRGT